MSIAGFFTKDHIIYYTEKVLKLRKQIQKTNFKPLKIILLTRYRSLSLKLQSFLPLSKTISNDLTFPHGLSGVFISNGATIGDGCVVFQQVTIGSNALPDSKNQGFPVIGKNCYIGAGAKIIGNVKIGDNVRIGAGTVVTKDIPDNATVVGASFRIFKHDNMQNNDFVVYEKEKQNEK